LRGVGLPDNLIDYLPSLLLNAPIQFHSCFISYSSKDHEFAERLYADLQNKGVRCWYAPEDMKIGDKFCSRIDQSIHLHDRLLLILSAHSITSPWVETEVETAFEKEEKEKRPVLFPIRVDGAVMDSSVSWAAAIRRTRHIGDFTHWKEHDAYQKALARVLRDLQTEDEKEQKTATREE
jgi:TIR domain-containing protein